MRIPSLPVQGAWIEIAVVRGVIAVAEKSLPVQGAWIEMSGHTGGGRLLLVAPRAGSVD